MILVRCLGKPFNITVIQAYAPTINTEETEVEWFYEEQDLLEQTHTHTQRCPFHHRGLECKVRNQEILGVTGKFDLGLQN